MRRWRPESIQARLFLLTGVVFACTLGYAAYSLDTLSAVKVNGPAYARIHVSESLLADVLPPPSYIVEPYLQAHLMARAGTPAAREAQVGKYIRLKDTYFRQHEQWRKALPEGPLKAELLVASFRPAERFFAAVDDELIPALQRGDWVTSDRVLEETLPPLFAEHRTAIDRVVELAEKAARSEEAEVSRLVETRQRMQWAIAAAFLVTTTGLALWIAVAVRRRAARFRALVENSTELVALCDATGAIRYHSPSVPKILGYAQDELIGQRMRELVHPEDVAAVDWELNAIVASPRQVIRFEVRMRNQCGGFQVVEVNGTNLLDDPAVGAIVANIRDVTATREADARLRDRDALLQKLSEQVPGVVFQYRWDADGRAWFPYVSEGIRTLFEVSPGEARGSAEAVSRRVQPKDQEQVLQALARSARDFVAMRVEYRVLLSDSRVRWVESQAAPERMPDGGVLWHGYMTDVTERKGWEARQSELVRELERRNAEMEQFTYTVSHDLKSPLVTIRGFLGAVASDVASGRTDRVASDLGRIDAAAGRMMALLDDLLALSRAGQVGGAAAPVRLTEVVREAAERVAGPAAAAGVTVRVAADLPTVTGDRVRLTEVFQNLLENAVKYSAGGAGPLLVEVSGEAVGGAVVCRVRDHGVGLDPRHRERIFGLFEKLDPRSSGTGVGLALVRKIVEFHGGRVWAESDGPGTGCTFVLRLPAPPSEPELAATDETN